MSQAKSLADLPEAHVRLLEQLCDDFERSWRAALRNGAARPRVEDVLAQLPEQARVLALRELAKVEVGQRRRHGERPASREYAGRPSEVTWASPRC